MVKGENHSKQWIQNMEKFKNRKKIWLYLFAYSVVFCICTFLVFIYFRINGKSFIWKPDGIEQHYPFLKYLCNNAGDMIKEFFSSGQLAIKEWDFSLGYGSSVFMSLSNAGMFDPITYLALLSPEDSLVTTYALLMILRIYLAGLSFSYMCQVFNKQKAFTLIGALTYCFSGFILYAGPRHPFFINPMIMLPLIIAGFEKIRTNKRPYLFCISIAVAFSMSFYFFFMITVLLFVYALVKFFVLSKKETRWKDFFSLFLRSVGYYIVGILLSAWFLLPLIVITLTNPRTSGGYSINLMNYPPSHYLTAITSLNRVDASNTLSWTIFGFSPLVVVSIFMLFTKEGKRFKVLRILTILAVIGVMFPIVGYVLSAFTYLTNRWSFVLPLLTSFVLVEMLPILLKSKIKNYKPVIIYLVIALTISIFVPNIQNQYDIIGLLLVALGVAIMGLLGYYHNKQQYSHCVRTLSFVTILGFSVFCIAIAGNQRYALSKSGYIKEFTDKNKVALEEISNKYAIQTEENTIERNEIAGSYYPNSAMNDNYLSTNQYFSMYNSNLRQFFNNMSLQSYKHILVYSSLGGRAPLMALWNANSFVSSSSKIAVPYGYGLTDTKVDKNNGNKVVTRIYQSKYPLSFGYTYDTFVTQEDYDTLNPVEKQQLLLHAAVIPEENKDSIADYSDAKALIKDEIEQIPYKISYSDGINKKDDKLRIKRKNASIILQFDGKPGREYYAVFHGQRVSCEGNKITTLTLTSSINRKTISAVMKSENYSMFTNLKSLAINLGYQENGAKEVVISFNRPCEFSYDDLKLYAVPMDQYKELVKNLDKDSMENMKVGTDTISGTMDLQEDKMACFSIPYALGWSAKVNGQDAELIRINDAFTGLYLKQGHNEIQMSYKLPMLRVGVVVSIITILLSLVAVGIYEIRQRIKRKR